MKSENPIRDNSRNSLTVKWLMGWRDICRAVDERTVIASVVPISGVGHTYPLFIFEIEVSPILKTCFYANLNSCVLDYVARQKTGGTHLTYFIINQFPILPPSAYTPGDLAFIFPRVLELTYTAVDLAPFAEDIWQAAPEEMRRLFVKQWEENSPRIARIDANEKNPIHDNSRSFADLFPPFTFDPTRRARLRAELDARYARLYGLSRDELAYILDPADVCGADYPSETFRVLKEKETAEYGEYRTRRLVLAAWDGKGA